jgi:lipocalin-like protein
MSKIFYFFLTLLIFSSCDDSKNSSLIVGNWQATEWLVNGKPSSNNTKETSFSFKDNTEYTFNYAGTIEKGNYKVVGDKLYTTPYAQQEMMVKIGKLTLDSLVFDMNRGGQSETLFLIKKN